MAKIVELALRMKCSFCGGGRYRLIELKDERLCCTSCLDELVGDPIPRQAIRWFAGEMEKNVGKCAPEGWRHYDLDAALHEIAEELEANAPTEKTSAKNKHNYLVSQAIFSMIAADLLRILMEASHEEE